VNIVDAGGVFVAHFGLCKYVNSSKISRTKCSAVAEKQRRRAADLSAYQFYRAMQCNSAVYVIVTPLSTMGSGLELPGGLRG